MGMFRVELEAVGNHGCQRDKKEGEEVTGCGQADCTDCITREYVKALQSKGTSVSRATISHWPTSEPPGPTDDLLAKTRSRPF